MSVAERDVIPGPIRDVLRRPDLDAAVARQRLRFEARVLRVHMINRRTQRGDRGERIGSHPEEMARVEVDPDGLADRVSQSEESTGAIDVLVAAQFEAQLGDAAALRISDELA